MSRDHPHGYGKLSGSAGPLPRLSAVMMIDTLLKRGLTIADIADAMGRQSRMVLAAKTGKVLSDRYAATSPHVPTGAPFGGPDVILADVGGGSCRASASICR